MWPRDWSDLSLILLSTVAVYATLVLLLRVSGKRSLSKWNAFDFIVTVALGSVLATGVLSKSVSALSAMVGLAALVALQFVVTWLSVRVRLFRNLVKGEPLLLVLHGEYRRDAMRGARVPEEEILASLRNHGIAHLRDVAALVLETNGTFSLLRELGDGPFEGAALRGVRGYEHEGEATSRRADPSSAGPGTP